MNIPDVLVANQLRNASQQLDALSVDTRLEPGAKITIRAIARGLSETADMVEQLPPWEASLPLDLPRIMR